MEKSLLKGFKMDLHIHTCLSPCGDESMSPSNIIKQAKRKGLDAVAICDHNCAENVIAVKKAAQEENIKVIGGMEVTSSEEVHFVVLFDENKDLFQIQKIVYENLPGENKAEAFGEQIVMDENGEIVKINKRFLIGATELSSNEVVSMSHKLNGLAIASHVDREGFGIIGKLGFIPPDLKLDALEISPRISFQKAKETLPVKDYTVITSSDAHCLLDIGKSFTTYYIKEISVKEIKKALSGKEGRYIKIEPQDED